MALATKCPHCGALFRVVADQLKLRGGLVRCGQCSTVFDAIGSLTYVDETVLPQSRASGAGSQGAAASPPPSAEESQAARHALGPATTLRISPVAPATLAGFVPTRLEMPRGEQDEPAVIRRRGKPAGHAHTETSEVRNEDSTPATEDRAPTLLEPDDASRPAAGELPVEERIEPIEVLAAEPATPAEEAAPAPEEPPSFLRPRRKRPGGFSIVYGGGSALLALLAVIQLAVIFRSDLMIHWPQSRLMLMDLCSVFRCTVGWPTQADQLAVIGTELQAIPGTDALELSTVIRNRAGFRQSLPAIEVTLTDARNRPLARKVFTPADYLASVGEPTSRLQEGLAPGSDFTIRIFFEARGLAPAGFLVYPFYL